MKLIITESPTKAKTLQVFLKGRGFVVRSSYGHIRDLPQRKLGVDIKNNFKPKYVVIPRAKKTVQFLKKEVEKASLIIISSDPDREGEAIAYHLVYLLNLNGQKPYQRIVFHEITKSAIETALKNPRKIDMGLVDAQQARRILDRLVGYKLSPFLWKKVARGLSAGRVQSVAVRLVVEREKEIENFVPQEYWIIEALLKKILNPKFEIRNPEGKQASYGAGKSQIQNREPEQITVRGPEPSAKGGLVQDSKFQNEFAALLVKKDGKIIPKFGIKTKEEAEKIVEDLKGADYKVVNIEKKEIKRNPLPPFTTSTLQQEAWRKFKFPAKFTMKIAQQLYERGYTTYHRTDSLNLSDLALFAAKKFIIENYGKDYWAGFLRKYKAKGRVQEAHEAIRPTYADRTPEEMKEKLDRNQIRLYDLVWRRFIACQMAQASFYSTNVAIEAGNPKFQIPNSKFTPTPNFGVGARIPKSKFQNPKYIFRASGQTLKFDGFLRVYPMKFEEVALPSLELNEILKLLKLIPSQHFTQPPPRYNEATLIKTLEENGIGRPSTYAPIISTIQERNYVRKDEKKRLKPTEVGIVVNDLLTSHFPEIVDIHFTAKMEESLDEIAKGKLKWQKPIAEFYFPFEKLLEKKQEEVSKKDIIEEKTSELCPKCKKPIVIKLGRYGKFYSCSNWPKCDFKKPFLNLLDLPCPKCKKGQVVQRYTRNGKIFYGCSRYPDCDFASWKKPESH